MENVVKSTEVKRRNNVRKLTALGMLGAISLILGDRFKFCVNQKN